MEKWGNPKEQVAIAAASAIRRASFNDGLVHEVPE
jgi:hypothetical protein